jgi:rare lipoprotein A
MSLRRRPIALAVGVGAKPATISAALTATTTAAAVITATPDEAGCPAERRRGGPRLAIPSPTEDKVMMSRQGGLVVLLLGTWSAAVLAEVPAPDSIAARHEAQQLAELPPIVPVVGRIDPSGRKQQGRVSYYSQKFTHRKMADGRPMNPQSNAAASKTLPLGTTARVTNLQNARSATVKIQDRGPYVAGRVIDVSPVVAEQLDLKKQGAARVEVKPITVPQPNGAIKLGAGAAEMTPNEIMQAAETTKLLIRTAGR